MGIQCAHSATYSINGLSINQLFAIANQQSRLFYSGVNPPSIPTIDIDASWLVRSKTSISPCHKVGYLLKVSSAFMNAGFNVVIVCDGEERHHSKRATIKRIADSYRSKITFLKNTNKIQSIYLIARVEVRTISDEERKVLNRLSSSTKSLEKKITNTIYDTGDTFFLEIIDKLNCIKLATAVVPPGAGSITVIQAEQQADTCIAARAFRYINNVVLSADSDQAVLLCNKCISIKAYSYNKNKNTIGKLDLFTGTRLKIIQIANYINLPLVLGENGNYVPAKFKLFDDLDELYNVRALIAVGIGCDVHPSGVIGIGPKIILKYINQLKHDNINDVLYYDKILEFYWTSFARKNKIRKEDRTIEKELEFKKMINTFVESYIYEPGNYFDSLEKQSQQENTYIYNQPTSLHCYNNAFRRNNLVDCCIVEGGVDCCVGPGTGEHMFLTAEGLNICLSCGRSICSCCIFKNSSNDGNIYCVECFLSESNISIVDLDEIPTEDVMRQVFEEHGCPTNMQDDLAERINLYQNIILNKKILDKDNYENIIKMPEQSTSYLGNLDVIVEFSFTSGGSFVNNENLPFEDLVEVLEIFRELIEVDIEENPSLLLTSNQITPKLVQTFAEKSRIHFGWRLLIRGLRHSIDLLTTDVSQTYVKIFKYQGQTGIYLRMNVRSSMKKDWYKTEIAFTRKTIVSCSCTCKCGSNNLEHIVCVHTLPCLELLGYFLKEALAEHTLIELSYYVKQKDLTNESDILLTGFRKCLEVLLITCNTDKIDEALKATSFRDMLSAYDVGTDKRKFGPPPPIDPKEIGPLKELCFHSINLVARSMRTGKVSKLRKKRFQTKDRDPMTHQLYVQTVKACCTFFAMFKQSTVEFLNHIVGYKVIEKRCQGDVFFTDIKQHYPCKHKMKLAIEKANCKYRIQIKRKYSTTANEINETYTTSNVENEPSNGEDNISIINEYNDNDDDNYESFDYYDIENHSSDDEDNDSDNDADMIEDNDPPVNLQEEMEVNATNEEEEDDGCNVTTTNTPEAIWSHVPNTRCQPINTVTKDAFRKRYALGTFHRQLYLKRLELNKSDTRTSLVHCNKHQLYLEQHNYQYKNKDNKLVQLTEMIRLPKDMNDNYTTTRKSIETRKPITPKKKKPSKMKYTIVSNNNKKRSNNQKCDFVGCFTKHTGDIQFKFKRLPPLSNIDPLTKKQSNKQRLYHTVKKVYSEIIRNRCGLYEQDSRQQIRICNQHKVEEENIEISWQPVNKEDKEKIIVKMYLPTKISDLQNDPEMIERENRKNQREVRNIIQERTMQHNSINILSNSQSQTTRHTLSVIIDAIDILTQSETSNKYDNTPFTFDYENKNKYKNEIERKQTIFRLDNTTDIQIKKNTGFKSLSNMISFVIIVNKGDVDKMIQTTTQLTWFEEYYLYFIVVWGRKCNRWFDVGELFNIAESTARRIFDNIQQEVLDVMVDWPKYTSFEEDQYLQRPEKWSPFFDGTRAVMWDMTDISIMQPSSAESSRLSYNKYYSGCCGKGGIFLQSSSWLGTHDLWMGAVTDSEYITRSGILQQQWDFVKTDVPNQSIPFTNITDKGFRMTAEAYRHGEQRVLQPPFMKSDKRFNTQQTVESAAIATIRSANERAVNRIKECHYVKKGLLEAENVERIAAVFLTFGFQSNFMFYPVQ